jgi:hypothetical protein
MSEIQITLPLDVFAGAKSLTPEGISEFLEGAIKNKEKIQQAQNEAVTIAKQALGFFADLRRVLDADMDEYKKFQTLRELQRVSIPFTDFLKGKIDEAAPSIDS